MLAYRVIFGLPAVEGEPAVGAADVVEVVRRLGEGKESCTGEALWRRLVLVELPLQFPVEKRREPVVILEVGLQVTLHWRFGRHGEGRLGEKQ
jgi:hypothetical protein